VDASYSVDVGVDGRVYITARTNSADFPVKDPFQGSFGGGIDSIFAIFHANGR
jgi:hypothetical protein